MHLPVCSLSLAVRLSRLRWLGRRSGGGGATCPVTHSQIKERYAFKSIEGSSIALAGAYAS
eukprot:790680-Pelagomonas_calceolata.AAC.1